VAASAELDFLERRDFFGVEAEESAVVAPDLVASALAAESAAEDFLERELFLVEEAELSAAAAESVESAFLDLLLDFDLDFEVELSPVVVESESAFLDFDLDLEVEESASFESEDCAVSAASDFFDFDLDLLFDFVVLESV